MAYYGDQNIIHQIYDAFLSNVYELPKSPVNLSKVIDVHIAARYYTQKGKLKLPRSKKSKLFGFCDIEADVNKLLILYKKGES